VDSGVKVTQVEKLEVRLACELILIEWDRFVLILF
jgi:hypothetical protein